MANPKLRFRFFEPDIDTQRPIIDGTVKIEGFELEGLPASATDWDATDYVSVGRVCGVVEGDGLVSIPVFPNRKFRTSTIYVNEKAGIEHPRDLEGKRVGIQSWSIPAGVWAKGALQNHYKVDLTKINWFSQNLTQSPLAMPLPAGIRMETIPRGASDAMLVEGELDAAIDANVLPSITNRDPRVRRLFRDWKTEAQDYWRATHIFPISHIVTLKQEFVDRHPNAPVALLKAYRQARDIAINRIEGADPNYLIISWASHQLAEQRAVMGERYWAYNIEDNTSTLEALTFFTHQQGLTPYRVDYQKLFHREAAAVTGW